MSNTQICRRPGSDYRTPEQKREALLLAAFRCSSKKAQFKMLRQAMKAVKKSFTA